MRSDPVSCTSVDGRPEDADAGSVKARKAEHLRARYGNQDPTISGTILRSPIFETPISEITMHRTQSHEFGVGVGVRFLQFRADATVGG